MSRFSLLDPLRDRWLAALGFALALAALALGLLPQGGGAQTSVLALRHAVAAGEIVRRGDVVAVPIASPIAPHRWSADSMGWPVVAR